MAKTSVVGTLGVALCACSSAWAANVNETFSAATTVVDGSKLGVCRQLTAATYGGGAVAVSGNGAAAITTTVETDAAILFSSDALPAAGFKVTVEVSGINYPQYTQENGVTLLTLANTKPAPGSALLWSTHRMLGVEVAVEPGATNVRPIFVNYWDAADQLYTWNGTAWAQGGNSWVPVLTYDPALHYQVTVEKGGSPAAYVITIRTGNTVLTQATVPVANVRTATSEYFVVGDRLTDYFRGSLNVHSVDQPMPASCGAPDAGPVADARTADLAGAREAAAADRALSDARVAIDARDATAVDARADARAPDAAPADAPHADSATADQPRAELDGRVPDHARVSDGGLDRSFQDGANPRYVSAACDCELSSAPAAQSPFVLIALCGFALVLARRRRR